MNYIKKFFNHVKAFEKYSKNTIKNYNICYEQFKEFIDKDLLEVTLEDIEHFIVWLKEKNNGLAKSTINTKLAALYSLFDFLRKRGYITDNPTEDIERRTPSQHKKVSLTKSEVERMIDDANLRDKGIISLLFVGGMRISELINLDITDLYDLPDDVEGNGVQLHVRDGKGDKDRFLYIPERYFKYVIEYLDKRDDKLSPLFISNRNKRLHDDTVRKMLDRVAKNLGINKKVTPHTLRRTCLTYQLNHGVDIMTVSKNAGHSDVSITDKNYTELADKVRAESTLGIY